MIALPRGGVPVAFEVARRLSAPLDVLAVRKLGAPANPEFAIGAIAEDGTAVFDAVSARRAGMTEATLERTIEKEARELRRRVERYRDERAPIDVRGRSTIVVDDGLATGLTDLAAVRALRARGAGRIVVAVPVGARQAVALVRQEADEVVCLAIPHDLGGVGRWYSDFAPVSDDEVLALLEAAGSGHLPAARQITPQGRTRRSSPAERELQLDLGGAVLAGDLTIPRRPRGIVVFAHGSGSSRRSPRNRAVAATLSGAGLGTLLFDLLTEPEGHHRQRVFDIPLLARRLEGVTRWVVAEPDLRELPVGYLGASTGAAAALRAAAATHDVVRAVVCRGGRPDLAADRLPYVTAPTLLLVGSRDTEVIEHNRRAAAMLRCSHDLVVIDGADHLFSEPGTLQTVARLAADWFSGHLGAAAPGLALVDG